MTPEIMRKIVAEEFPDPRTWFEVSGKDFSRLCERIVRYPGNGNPRLGKYYISHVLMFTQCVVFTTSSDTCKPPDLRDEVEKILGPLEPLDDPE